MALEVVQCLLRPAENVGKEDVDPEELKPHLVGIQLRKLDRVMRGTDLNNIA
jgi:hypothetical protein